MNITVKNYKSEDYLPKFQEGGAMPPEAPQEPAGAPAEAPAEDPTQQVLAACQQALETQDCNLAMQICQAVIQMLGGGVAAPQAPEGQAPVYKKGGVLSRWIKK